MAARGRVGMSGPASSAWPGLPTGHGGSGPSASRGQAAQGAAGAWCSSKSSSTPSGGVPGGWWAVPAGEGWTGWKPRALGGHWDTGWGLEWREGLDLKNKRGRGKWRARRSQCGWSADGNGLQWRGRGRSPLRSGLWQSGTSGRAHGRPGGSSRCHPPQWTVPSHSPHTCSTSCGSSCPERPHAQSPRGQARA